MSSDLESAAVPPAETDPLVIEKKDDEQVDDDDGAVEEDKEVPSVVDDVIETLKLAGPIFLSMLSYIGMKTTDSALLGHVSSDALAAAALSDLWTMTTSPLIFARVLGVLVGGAIGSGNHKLAGIYLQVAYFVICCIAIFVVICWSVTDYVWIWYGSEYDIAKMAGYYARILAIGIPGQILFGQGAQFFTAQRIMQPEVTTAGVALVLNLILGLVFVLGIQPFSKEFDGYGFAACPVVTTVVVYAQCFVFWFVYVYIQRLHEACWDGWSWKDITRERIRTFSELYLPAALGLASDFWRVAVVGVIAAGLGTNEVAVFNTSYRIMWIVIILVSAIAGAAGVNISIRLGKLDDKGANQAAHVGASVSAIILVVISTAVLFNIRLFGRIFTNDENFLSLFEDAKLPFTLTLFMMNMSVALECIPNSMGRQKDVFRAGFVASWLVQVPAVILLTLYWRDDLVGIYSGMAIGYTVLAFLYGYMAHTSDWKKYARLAHERAEMPTEDK